YQPGQHRADDDIAVRRIVETAQLAFRSKSVGGGVDLSHQLVDGALGRGEVGGSGHDDPEGNTKRAIVHCGDLRPAQLRRSTRLSASARTGQLLTAFCA